MAHAASFSLAQNGVHTTWTKGNSITSTFATAPHAGDLVVVGINFMNNSNCGTILSVKDANGNVFTVTTPTTTNASVGGGCMRIALQSKLVKDGYLTQGIFLQGTFDAPTNTLLRPSSV